MRKQPYFTKKYIHTGLSGITFPEPTEKPVNTGNREYPRYLLPIYGGYDTETTTSIRAEGHRACVYSHAFTLANSRELHIYHFRRWEEFSRFLEMISDHYDLGEERRLVLLVANLSFEFSFLEHRLSWDEVFAKEMRQPLLARSGGIEFRECLSISGGSLATLAADYCYTQKMIGDLDYKKLRNYDDILDDTELGYIYNDVIILAEYSRYLFQHFVRRNHQFPMTRTGILLRNIKNRFHNMEKMLGTPGMYQDYIRANFPDKSTYDQWFKFLFRGGYVHANALYTGVELLNVLMKDITSSYPFVMLAKYVPRGAFRRVSYDPKYLKSHCCIIYATIRNIHLKTAHSIESKNKIIYAENAKYDNGRLVSADLICVMLTELDLDIYKRFYKGDIEINDFYISERSTLPRFLLDQLLESYIEKNRLKSTGQDGTPEYSIVKSDVNSTYGATVKRLRLDTITFGIDSRGIECWHSIENDKNYQEESAKSLLLPQWGIWITSHARHRLLSTVDALTRAGVKCIYHDTDSIKYIQHPAAERIFKCINAAAARALKKRGYTDPYIKGLGEFENEIKDKKDPGKLIPVRMKTLGAKRYIYYNPIKEKVIATVAGMPKSSIRYIRDRQDKELSKGLTIDEIFDMFSDAGFSLACEQSAKLRPDYTDEPYSLYINGQWMEEESGCALVEVPFSLKLKSEYYHYIHQIRQIARIGGNV
jgi:hypothetical protein